MSFNLILSISAVFVTVSQAEFTTVMKQTVPVEKSHLRQMDSSFFHHEQAFSALEAGQDEFKISEKHENKEGFSK